MILLLNWVSTLPETWKNLEFEQFDKLGKISQTYIFRNFEKYLEFEQISLKSLEKPEILNKKSGIFDNFSMFSIEISN